MLKKEDWMDIREQLEKGFYQKDIANRLGVHPKTVSYVLLIEPFLKLFPDIHPVLLLEHRRTPRSSSHPSKGTPPRFFEGTFYFDIQGTFNIDNDRL